VQAGPRAVRATAGSLLLRACVTRHSGPFRGLGVGSGPIAFGVDCEVRHADGEEEKISKEDDEPQLMGEAKTSCLRAVFCNKNASKEAQGGYDCHCGNTEDG